MEEVTRYMKVGMVTTWKVQCGVAKYTEALCNELSNSVNLTVYAEELFQQKTEDPPISDNPKSTPIRYIRCWKRGEILDKLYQTIVDDLPDIVHIQYDPAMYMSERNVLNLLNRLHKAEIKTVVTLHEVPKFNPTVYGDWYKKNDSHFITTNKLMDKELKKWYKDARSTIIPLGSTIFQPIDKHRARQELGLEQSNYYIIQFGYYGWDKGMIWLIKAMPEIIKSIPNAVLVFAGGLHPLAPPIHKSAVKTCIRTALKLNLQKHVLFPGKLLFGRNIDVWLSAADILVLNHQSVFGTYSASACGHRILCTGRPIVMNANAIRLLEFVDGTHCLKSSNKELSQKIVDLSKNSALQSTIIKRTLEYAYYTSFENIAKQHLEVYKSVK